jgi:hypothetical protein
MGLLLSLSSCTARVPAAIETPAEPQTKPAAPPSEPLPVTSWYGDLKVTPRKQAAQGEPSPPDDSTLPEPTAEELDAWEQTAKHETSLREWDQANLAEVTRWWLELQCLHLAVVSVGNSTYNANDSARWLEFESVYAVATSEWMSMITNPRPEVISSSKAFGYALEAHDLLWTGYPMSFKDGDAEKLQNLDEWWARIAKKFNNYLVQLGESRPALDPENPDDLAACRPFLDSW